MTKVWIKAGAGNPIKGGQVCARGAIWARDLGGDKPRPYATM